MRILVLSDLPPDVLGGAEVQTQRLIRQWLESGHLVEVAGHRSRAGLRDIGGRRLRVHNLRVLRSLGTGVRAISYFLSLASLLLRRRRRYDLIYCRFLSEAALSVVVLKAMGLIALPLVSTPAAAGSGGDAALISSLPFTRSLVGLLNRYCNALNIIAPAIQQDLDELGIKISRSTRIPNGVDCPEIRPRDGVTKPRRLLFTGRLAHQKGLDNLFYALNKIPHRKDEYRLLLAGSGEQEPYLRDLARELALDVEFLGEQSQASIWSLLDSSDVFLLPSRYEGLSNAALEAMAAGLPVVATRCHGIDEYIEPKAGWVCEVDDIDDLSQTLDGMLDCPPEDLLFKGMQARRTIEERFAISKVADEYLQLFSAVLSGHGARER